MKTLWQQTRSFPPAVRLLMANQFAINLAFYMLMPYLAAHLSGGLGLAAWAVGLVLGVRNFSQQGMFLIGGTLADRFGYKAPIMAGCLLRTLGFGLLGWVDSLPALIAASAATGFAGALFNPAVRAYLAVEAGERRVDAFATFNVYYQAGMLLGPLVGLALLAADFRLVCTVAAAIFAVLTVLQWRALPARHGDTAGTTAAPDGVLAQWRTVVANRPFLLFATAMIGSYVLTFQVYLALPLAASNALGSKGTWVTSGLFVVSAAVAVMGQLRLTGWAKQRWSSGRALVRGLTAMGLAFLPLALTPPGATGAVLAALVAAVVLLAAGSAVVYPFEMDTVVTLSGNRLVATHYGLYNTVSGFGITLGNLATGALWDFAARHDALWLTWCMLTVTGLICAASVAALARSGRLAVREEPQLAPA
ncbi:MFS transporter [Streptomyces albogriseolus]|uniref:MFS transporter n=3 Tax=Streptomyces TaxID=1883 RepID=A0A7T7L6P6_9ACTN|nr:MULTISPECIES: MFS transporter [Streptomyces]WUC76664.1 MFS transporter [Streptomyces longwoodensis]GHC24409.1 putative ABC transport system membrane protein [Streptomyces albogriseolus]AHE40316.1 Putative MFS transporter [Streptomyces sp. F12]MCX5173911.1 MFS transporter [Streptomyces antibioticus]QQM47462.1 MFS transporter [Streptomyces liliifuscus]